MNQAAVVRAVVVFAGLLALGLMLTLMGAASQDETQRLVLPVIGAATYGAGLTFFLVEMFALDRRHRDAS